MNGALVLGHNITSSEAGIAAREVTFKRFLSCVTALVPGQVAILSEACPTLLADKRLLSRMGALVRGKVG